MILKDLQEMINRTVFCASGRKVESGKEVFEVFIEKKDGELIMAATDRQRLGFSRHFIGDKFPDFDGVFVSAPFLTKIAKQKKSEDPVSITINDKEVNFQIGFSNVTTKAISENLFNLYDDDKISKLFHCVVPKKVMGGFIRHYRNTKSFNTLFSLSLTVNRKVLINSLKNVSVIMDPLRLFPVDIDISPGTMSLSTCDYYGSAEDEIPCDYSGEKTSLLLYAKYFSEVIECIDTDNIQIMFNSVKSTVAVFPVTESLPENSSQVQDNYYFLNQMIRE